MAATMAVLFTATGLALADRPTAERGTTERATTHKGAVVWMAKKGEWAPLPDVFPTGGMMQVIQGDPATGPSDVYLKFPANYSVPWHYHTAVERVYVDKGSIKFEMMEGETTTLTEGGFMLVPSRMVHKASCVSSEECTLYLASSAPFDIHVVDRQGRVTRSWTPARGTEKLEKMEKERRPSPVTP
jgi:quercetin dioxygenase-like cupin family protein